MSFTNAQLAQKIADLIDYWSSFNEEYSNWLGGAVDGGPGSDGKYPLTNWAGAESLVESPAKLADNVSGYVGLASASEAAAAASAAAALTSESNAAASEAQATSDAAAAAASAAAASVDEGLADSSATVATAQANLATDRAGYAAEWANKAEDSLVSVAAGGDNVDDYSAMHHAIKAAASAAAALVSETNAAASAAAAATFDPALYAALADNETVTGQYTFSHASGILIGAAPLTATLIGQWNTAYSWGDHAGLYAPIAGYNNANWDTAYGWGDHSTQNYAVTTGDTFTGAMTFSGAATFNGYVNGALKLYESRQAAGLSLDTLLVDAVYHMSNATGAGHPAGETLAYGNLMVFDNSDVHTQVYFSRHDDGRIYTRTSNASPDLTGVGWNRLWSDADFDHADFLPNTGVAAHSGDIDFSNILGDRITLWGTHDNAASYAIGIEGGTMYFKGDAQYRWYFDQNADGGVGHTMELTPTSLLIAADNGEGDVRLIIEADRNNVGVETDQAELWLAQDGRGVTGYFRTRDDNNLEIGSSSAIGTFVTPVMQWAYNSNAVTFPGIITAGGQVNVAASTGIRTVTGQYGAFQTQGSTGGYGGISFDGNFVWMNSGSSHIGLYNDINNEWMILAYPNGLVRLYYNGIEELATVSGGITIGNSDKATLSNQAGGRLRVSTAYGYTEVGPNNTSWAHFNTDRANFYFSKGMSINGVPKRYNAGAIAWHGSSSYASHKVTFSTSAATGGSSGDIWYQYS